jgi:hypothetical protein
MREIEPKLAELLDTFHGLGPPVQAELQAVGLYYPSPVPASEDPSMPLPQVSRLTNDQLGDLQGAYAEWASYVGSSLADLRSDKKDLAVEIRLATALVKRGKTGTKDERDDATQTDPHIIALQQTMRILDRKLDVVEELLERVERRRRVLSRYVEIRKLELEAVIRGNSISRMRSGLPPIRRAATIQGVPHADRDATDD